jgi:hypothetical protein
MFMQPLTAIGESLAVIGSRDLIAGRPPLGVVEITRTSFGASQRVLQLPMWATSMLWVRFMTGARLDQPLFPAHRGFRDPANVRRDIRDPR